MLTHTFAACNWQFGCTTGIYTQLCIFIQHSNCALFGLVSVHNNLDFEFVYSLSRLVCFVQICIYTVNVKVMEELKIMKETSIKIYFNLIGEVVLLVLFIMLHTGHGCPRVFTGAENVVLPRYTCISYPARCCTNYAFFVSY